MLLMRQFPWSQDEAKYEIKGLNITYGSLQNYVLMKPLAGLMNWRENWKEKKRWEKSN